MRTSFNLQIFLPAAIISIFSIFLIWSINLQLLVSHITAIIIGIIFYFLILKTEVNLTRNLWLVAYLLLVAGLLLVFLQPAVRGSHRWIFIKSISLQIAEVGKPLYIVSLAGLSSYFLLSRFKNSIFFILLGLPPIFLIVKQPDLGNASLFFIIWLALSFSGHIKLKYILLFLLIVLTSIPFGWFFLKDYQQQRIVSFLSPSLDTQGIGYNAAQALIAVGSGKLFGRGLGRGTQSHLRFLPESYTDFIFASATEELGFIGGAILIVLYGILLYQLLSLAIRSQQIFTRSVAIGIFVVLFSQIFINIGMNLGLVPITGVTLPLISYGGSSIVSTFILLGLAQSISNSIEKREILIR